MSLRSLLFGAVLLLAPLASLPTKAAPFIKDVAAFTLSNGMQVVVIPDHRAPVVTHMVWYKVGSADEPQGEAGIAHFLEHLMFKGTPRHPPGEFNRLIRLNGGDDNAFTTRDYTAFYQSIAKDRLELVMDLEADRMQNLVLKDENVLPERDVILEERRQRIDNDPSSLLSEQLDAILYLAHPYRKPVIGWLAEMAKLDRQEALDFYHSHYTPSNAVLVVAGDVTTDEVRALAEKYYGVLKNTFAAGPRDRTPEPEPIAPRRVTLKDDRAATPLVQRSYLAPSYATSKGHDAEALDVLAEVLGGGATGRLYHKLVVEQRVASYAGAWYSGDGLDSGSFGVYGTPAPDSDIAKVESALDGVLDEVVKNGITPAELARAKNQLQADAIYSLDSQGTLAQNFGVALTTGTTVEDVLQWPDRIAAVTIEEVNSAAARILDLRRSATAILLPGAHANEAGAPVLPTTDTSVQQ